MQQSAAYTRIDLIQAFIDRLKATTYLEIGVSKGDSLLRVKCKSKLAVDPKFRIKTKMKIKWLARNFSNINIRYFEVTSNDFFAENTKLLAKIPPQVVFIDGLHTFEATLTDVYNALNYLDAGGVIVMHDCNPPHEASSVPALSPQNAKEKWNAKYPDRKDEWTGEWCGDSWKAIAYIIKHHPELQACVLNADYGLGIVAKKQIEKAVQYPTTLPENIAEFLSLDFADFGANRLALLNLKALTDLDSVINTIVKSSGGVLLQ